MTVHQSATEFLTGLPAGVSAVSRGAGGLLSSWIENGFSCSVLRDGAGRPVLLTAERAGRGTRYQQTFSWTDSGALDTMGGATIPTVLMSELMSGGTIVRVDASGAQSTPDGGAVAGGGGETLIASAALASTTGKAGVIYTLSDGADKGARLCWATPAGAGSPTWCWWLWPQAAY